MTDSPKKPSPPLGGFITLLVLGCALWWCTEDHSPKPSANKVSSPSTHYPDPDGVGSVVCQRFAKMNLRHPATADFDWGINIQRLPDGMTITTQKFTAKNSFGVPGRMVVECKFDINGIVDGRVYEIVE